MAKNRQALGRGLDALIPVVDEPETTSLKEQIIELEISKIIPNPFQPRKEFPPEKILELASSIRESGLLQPISVRKIGATYEIITGERRLRAFKSLNRQTIPATVREASNNEMRALALIENIQREDLNEIEEAKGFEELLTSCGLSHEELAHKIGKSRPSISNSLRLLKLPLSVQDNLVSKKISMGHARALLSLEKEDEMESLCIRIIEKGLSVREVELLLHNNNSKAKKASFKKPSPSSEKNGDPDIEQLKEDLQYALGTQVKIVGGEVGKGYLNIEFYSSADLTRISGIILKK